MLKTPDYPEEINKKILEELDRLDSKCKDKHILTIYGGKEPVIQPARIMDDYFLSVNAKDSLQLIAQIAYFKGIIDGVENQAKQYNFDYVRLILKKLLDNEPI